MKCEDIIERLYAYTDGELNPEEAVNVRAHLSECRQCASRAENQDILIAKFRDGLQEDVQCPDLSALVMNQLVQPVSLVQRLPRPRLYRAAGFAFALVLAVGIWLTFSRQPDTVGVIVAKEDLSARTAPLPVEQSIPVMSQPETGIASSVRVEPLRAAPVRRSSAGVSSSPRGIDKQEPAKPEPEQTPDDEVADAGKKSLLSISVNEAPSDGPERIREVTATLVMANGLEVSWTERSIITTLPPNEEAEFIERPPLTVIVEPQYKIDHLRGEI